MNFSTLPETVNYHFTSACNMNCRFCFAQFKECKHHSLDKHKAIIQAIASAKTTCRINFVGGEPTVYPYIEDLLFEAKRCGLRTSLVSNGFYFVQNGISKAFSTLDLLGISIDSLDFVTNRKIGRVVNKQVISIFQWMKLLDEAKEIGLPVKINTTVTEYNKREDFSDFIRTTAPLRWKVFQAISIAGQNDSTHNEWQVDSETFEHFVLMHQMQGLCPVVENEDTMKGSYAMISPDGRFYDTTEGYNKYSEPILKVGIQKAWSQVSFDPDKFNSRTLSYKEEVCNA